MKKFLVISILGLITIVFTSCKWAWTCQCEAEGYVDKATLNAALQAHKNDCTTIADNGPIYDNYYDVSISCSY